MSQPAAHAQPPPQIYVTEADLDRLYELVGDHEGRLPGARLLQAELERAVVVREGESPERFVRLGSLVTFEDPATAQVRVVRLVEPQDADIDQGRISVLSPVGAALIGLVRGAEFAWTDAGGRTHAVRLVDVENAHDRVGA